MNTTLEIAGFEDHSRPGWMRLSLATPGSTLQVYANESAPPQLLLGIEGDADADTELVDGLLAALERIALQRQTASAFALPAAVAPFDALGFVRGPERRLLRGVLEDDALLQVFPMYGCELTADGSLPPLANFRRWTNLLSPARSPQPWFHFRLQGRPSGLDVPQWSTESWSTFEDFVDILARDDAAWLEVRNRQGRILRLPGAHGWDCARERIEAHVGRDSARGSAPSPWSETRAG